jgi:ubiquinone/menaquinone biosynthesis C-methylase UbiE
MSQNLNVESAVRSRYSTAAQTRVEALCCPVDYDPQFLKVIPQEILDRDYGCGDPSKHLRKGDRVLDLGCGAGKICFIASQVVGPEGRVIGVDMNDEMLALARGHQRAVGDVIGWHNVEFRKGRIQDLALDLDRLDAELQRRAITGIEGYLEAESRAEQLRVREPLVPTGSMDAVVSNCVLNLVEPGAKRKVFPEVFRVLTQGGRAVISDIVSNKPVPESLHQDPELWSGCISGALLESEFVDAFAAAGFQEVQVLARDAKPWRVVEGIEFRSVTIEAWKGAANRKPGDASESECCGREKCC